MPRPGAGQPNALLPGGAGAANALPGAGTNPNALPPGAVGAHALPGVGAHPNALPPAGVPGVNVNGAFVPGAGLGAGAAGAPMAGMALPGVGALAGAGAGSAAPGGQPLAMALAQPLGAMMPLARQPANAPWLAPSPAQSNPRAEAAAAALQGKTLASAPAAQATPANPAAARAALGAPGSAQAVALAQAALAQALGKVLAGQTTAGSGAVALAEAQLAVRASKLALTQAALAAQGGPGPRGGAAAQAAQPGTLALRAGASAALTAGAPQGRAAAQGAQVQGQVQAQVPRPDQKTQAPGQRPGRQAAGAAGEPGHPAPLAGAPMPRALAAALARAPKLRKRGTYDRVEAVDRHLPRQQAPEMEDEDFWDGAGDDADAWDGADTPVGDTPPGDADAQRHEAALAAAQHYRALRAWLAANDQQVLLRELAAGRRVLVLAPPDQSHQRLIGHLLRPDAARPDRVTAPGTTGRAWALAARWSATLPADPHWRQWRVRQAVSATGEWCIETSQPNRYTPRLAASESRVPAGTAVGEAITLLDPRRLRRLMGSQWTLAVLRVPVPLDAGGTAG